MDFITDQNPTAIYAVGIQAGDNLPDYVKESAVLQVEDVADLADTAFADSRHRLHPIHTKAATYMSAVYLAGEGKTDTKEFANVKRAAAFYGITDDVDAALVTLGDINTQTKAAAATQDMEKYALTFNIEEGEDEAWTAYPVDTYLSVVKSATDVMEDWNRQRIPTDWLHTAAKVIVKRANDLGITHNELPARVWDIGTERVPDFDIALDVAETRKHAFAGTNGEAYIEAVKSAANGTVDVDTAVNTWMELDATNGVDHRKCISPHAAFYSGPTIAEVEKVAADHVVIKDVMVPYDVVGKLAANKTAIHRMFNKEAAEKVFDAITVLTSDPTPYVTDGSVNVMWTRNKGACAKTSAAIATLPDTTQKTLLELLIAVDK